MIQKKIDKIYHHHRRLLCWDRSLLVLLIKIFGTVLIILVWSYWELLWTVVPLLLLLLQRFVNCVVSGSKFLIWIIDAGAASTGSNITHSSHLHTMLLMYRSTILKYYIESSYLQIVWQISWWGDWHVKTMNNVTLLLQPDTTDTGAGSTVSATDTHWMHGWTHSSTQSAHSQWIGWDQRMRLTSRSQDNSDHARPGSYQPRTVSTNQRPRMTWVDQWWSRDDWGQTAELLLAPSQLSVVLCTEESEEQGEEAPVTESWAHWDTTQTWQHCFPGWSNTILSDTQY